MKAAIVKGPGLTPVYGDFEEPVAEAGEECLTVSAAALSHLVKGRAAGTHYSASGDFPFVAGIDGTGRRQDGTRVYFMLPRAPFGAMAERTVVSSARCLPLPDGLDDVTAAAIVNPGMSSWAAFSERARLLPGETVLINGATGIAGRMAVLIARHLGAAKVIATGRNAEALRSLGADATVLLTEDETALEKSFQPHFAERVDVVIDYLWGKSARAALIVAAKTAADGVPLRFVQIGAMSGAEIALPAAVLRAAAIELMGSGLGSVPRARLIACIGAVLKAAVPAGLTIATNAVPLSRVEQTWSTDDSSRRTVLTV
jgi:NADPH:quinone reductase-like Zn-dependent oxidoreductase